MRILIQNVLLYLGLMISLWADVISVTGEIDFNVDNAGPSEMTLNARGLGIGLSPEASLHVSGCAIIAERLSIGGDASSSNVNLHGSFAILPEPVSGDQNLESHSVYLVDTTSGNLVLTLPVASECPGRILEIKKNNLSKSMLDKKCLSARRTVKLDVVR